MALSVKFCILVLCAVAAGLSCGGASEEDCTAACSWYAQSCTAADARSSCIDDCRSESKADVEFATQQCVGMSVSTCKSAGCCLGFVYESYYYRTNCL